MAQWEHTHTHTHTHRATKSHQGSWNSEITQPHDVAIKLSVDSTTAWNSQGIARFARERTGITISLSSGRLNAHEGTNSVRPIGQRQPSRRSNIENVQNIYNFNILMAMCHQHRAHERIRPCDRSEKTVAHRAHFGLPRIPRNPLAQPHADGPIMPLLGRVVKALAVCWAHCCTSPSHCRWA